MRRLILTVALISGITACAELQTYSFIDTSFSASFALPGADMSAYTGLGAGWNVSLYSIADVNKTTVLGSTSVGGNSGDTLYWLGGWNSSLIEELTEVHFRVTSDDGLRYIDSASYVLQDVGDPIPPGSLNVSQASNLLFTGSSWQAVPEPAAASLLGLGGILTLLVRRKWFK